MFNYFEHLLSIKKLSCFLYDKRIFYVALIESNYFQIIAWEKDILFCVKICTSTTLGMAVKVQCLWPLLKRPSVQILLGHMLVNLLAPDYTMLHPRKWFLLSRKEILTILTNDTMIHDTKLSILFLQEWISGWWKSYSHPCTKTSVCGGSLALFCVHIHMQCVRLLLSLKTLCVPRNFLERFLAIIPVQGIVQMHEITVFLTSVRGSV